MLNHSVGSQGDLGGPTSGLFDTQNIKIAGTLMLLDVADRGERPIYIVGALHGRWLILI